jgi:LysM repeat protein
MAKNISTTLSVDLGNVVNNAIITVSAIRKTETARKEAEFQRAIANGLSYEDQIKMREEQLKNEQNSALGDPDFISTLEQSITNTKKLSRFNKYRTNYATSLGELSSGKINEEDYLSTLKSQLTGIDDPELRLEIQGDIASAEQKVKEYRDTILSNQVKKAKYDGTKSALTDAVARVNTARATALINDNTDEVTAYDETLSALQSQLSSVGIQDSITDFQVKSSTRGTKPVEKLNFINGQIQNSDPNVAIKIGDKTYTSAQQFWSQERDTFLAGTSQIFGNFFDELNADTKNTVDVATAKFGYPTQATLDSVFSTFNELRAKPEVTPFVSRLDVTQASIMSGAVDTLAKTINAVGTNNLTFQEADVQLQNIQTKYGIDVSGYRLQLDEQLRNLARSGILNEGEAAALAPDVKVELPKVSATTATTPTNPTPTVPSGTRIVRAGDTLSGIAKEAGVGLQELLQLNPQFQQNPSIIRPGQSVTLPGKTEAIIPSSTPTTTEVPPKPVEQPQTTTPKEGDFVPGKGVLQPDGTYAPQVTPKTPTKPVTTIAPEPTTTPYAGSSIVDYLKSQGQDTSFTARQKLATEKGIVNYTGTSEQNTQLLKTLRGS